MRTVWIVDWEELSVVCPTKRVAIGYVKRESKEINAKIKWGNSNAESLEFFCTLNDKTMTYRIHEVSFEEW